ncbi:MAG: nucleotidyltransferase domain-containing protein [Thermoprotei archaeon]
MEFEEFVERVVQRYGGKVTVVLFGSRARGDHWPSSDYDVAVILPSVDDPVEEAAEIYHLKRGFPADIVVLTPKDLENSVIRQMLKDRKVLYDGLKLFQGRG